MKNPFELRADCLKQAQDLLEGQYKAAEKVASDMFFDLMDKGFKTAKDMAEYMPKYPTHDEIMAQAKKFYEFVSTKWVTLPY